MTTNCPKKLDAAMTRPGRVDLVEFIDKATRETARNIFIRMYSTSNVTEEVQKLATEFATCMEDKDFSPAKLQELFLKRNDPKKHAQTC